MNEWNVDEAYNNFKAIYDEYPNADTYNESDTRAKLITRILRSCLGWEERDMVREEFSEDTGKYLDYKLSVNTPCLIVEAKRSSLLFDLPKTRNHRELKIGGVVSSSKLFMQAVEQARAYALSKGVPFCCVTNGYQYGVFRTQNSVGRGWNEHKLAVFDGFDDIEKNFSKFCDYLSKYSYESGYIHQLLRFDDSEEVKSRGFKTLETLHLNHPRKKNRNSLFYQLEDIVRRVFQDLASEDAEKEILEHCYVESPRKKDKGLPYLDIEVDRLQVDKKSAGDFQKRIVSLLTSSDASRSEVIFLLGSVGVGKSTFIQRFRKVLASSYIDDLGVWVYLDFRGFSDTGDILDRFVYEEISNILDSDYESLGLGDWNFIKSAYHAEYNSRKRGIWKPVYEASKERFEEKFSDFISNAIDSDPHAHIEKILRHASGKFNRKVFLVFDNADQLSPETQSEIFLLAQKMSDRLRCNTLISMREESYWKNRDSGPLNAFHTVAYHVQAPRLEQILSKRFQYAKSLINSGDIDERFSDGISADELTQVLDRIQQTLLGENLSYIDFISAIAPRDTRRALDDVAAFVVSGHTNLNAILRDIRKSKPSGLLVPFHEFLNSVVLRDQETFLEDKSSIINLYGISGHADASNGNRIAVLGRILSSKNVNSDIGTGYLLIDDLVSDIKSVGISEETCMEVLSLLVAKRLVETETTIKDTFENSSFVRATLAGEYYINKLSTSFGYLDIVVSSTPIGNNKPFSQMTKLKEQIAGLNSENVLDRLNRVKLRVKLVRLFVDYLVEEIGSAQFIQRNDLYNAEILEFTERLERTFLQESKVVVENATKVFQGTDE
ncbi:P-loop NTPase fold protein [Thalassolituus sp.]|uniref:P-loop NTPase fold protein n=1 Tax=Thalassolituus sp. TaxID=2030822 RepID=UPI00261D2C38|nr:P-loop NTPase fold protein [Thalassolituus sp.]